MDCPAQTSNPKRRLTANSQIAQISPRTIRGLDCPAQTSNPGNNPRVCCATVTAKAGTEVKMLHTNAARVYRYM